MTTTTTTRKTSPSKPRANDVVVTHPERPEPQDHKPKAEKVKAPTVTKVDGGKQVTYELADDRDPLAVVIADEALDDFELMGELRLMQDTEDPSYMPGILLRLLGREQMKTAMDALRDPETGRVSAVGGMEYVQAVFQALSPNS